MHTYMKKMHKHKISQRHKSTLLNQMRKHAPSASNTRAFLFSPNPNKGMLTPLFCAPSCLHSDKERGNQGREEFLPSPGGKEKSLPLFVCLVFCGVNLSTADQRVVQQSVVFSQRKRTRGKREVNKNKQLLLSPATSGETGLYLLAYECARSSPQRIDKRKKINNKINKKMNKQKLSPWGCPSHQTRKD